ncbi:MAG: GDSL-type esterase/lipase family protein [Streptococcaceae bacterium]|jgi:lysophospholipase L1-like esterase|nr:GDSL-type esterase/lipase family protein [Streptococcaceae bacterium]
MSEETKSLTLNPDITRFQNNLISEYKEKNQTVKKGQTLFLGSSIMEIFPIEKWEAEGKVKFDHYIYNRAVRATTTLFVLEHIDTQIFELAPSKIFINIGTNDIGFQVPEAIFRANYETIIREVQEQLPNTEIYILKYYPVNNVDFGSDADEATLFATRSNEAFNAASAKNQEMAKKLGVHFIDVSDGLADENGNLKKEYTFDGAHILTNGCEVILKNLEKYL